MQRTFRGKRALLVVALLVSASFLIGAVMAKRVMARGDGYENLRVFTEVLSLVQSNYVEEIEGKKLLEGAIKDGQTVKVGVKGGELDIRAGS